MTGSKGGRPPFFAVGVVEFFLQSFTKELPLDALIELVERSGIHPQVFGVIRVTEEPQGLLLNV